MSGRYVRRKPASSSQPMEVVPDAEGPYKWLVVFAAFMIQFLASGVTYCVGVFYVIFRQNLGGSSSLISFVSALNTGVFFGIGPVTGAIVNRYGCRGVAITGGLIGTLGLVLTAFVSQPWHLIITFGIITGFGLGLCYIPSITVISLYFGRNRSLAMGIAVTGLGAGPITFPPLLTYLDHVFGWRGAILLSAGLYLHSVVFAALLRHRTVWKGRRKLPGSPKEKEKVVSNGNHIQSRRSSLRNIPLLIFCIQNLIFSFGLSVINVHIGAFAISIGYSADQASMLFFAMGVASAISRVIYGLTVKVPLLRPIRVFTFTVLLCGAFTIAYPFCKSYIALVIIVSSIGVFYASYGSLPPLITIDLVGVENLATSYGYVCVADGIGFFLGGPIAGILYDSSKFYPASLWLGGGSMVISSIFMVTVWILDARLRHKMITENTLEVVS